MKAIPRVVAVIVTRDRADLLDACLEAIELQSRPPDAILVIDNASSDATPDVIARHRSAVHLRQSHNLGAAGGYCLGIAKALGAKADFVWMMDDDGRPADCWCLVRLLRRAHDEDVQFVAPLVLDVTQPARLAFPLRLGLRTLFRADQVIDRGVLHGFAHLFNGALIGRSVFERIGLPDPRFVIRGDEVEFLYRARRAGIRIALDCRAQFLHPSSDAERYPICFGLFYAMVPADPAKQVHQFRNRAYLFRAYRRLPYLLLEPVRYGWYFLLTRRGDWAGLARWAAASWSGLSARDPGSWTPQSPDALLAHVEVATKPGT
jgi:rhamnopyranosyl-N-acetylglucosaminyl-diphospho-decaprenol beta-1,3/1,4-galactofuranosyltransferase